MKHPFWSSPWCRWLIGLLFVAACLNGVGMLNALVSLKYETATPGQCRSSVSGDDLCAALQRCQTLALGAVMGAMGLAGMHLWADKK